MGGPMRRSLTSIAGLAQLFVAALTLSMMPSTARAEGDCPPGSVHKSEDGFSWCEPTVCTNDGQCGPNEVCRKVGLCMEVGTLANAASVDAGKRLVVTQRCAPDKTCPQTQTCSDLTRCVSRSDAQKMGILHLEAAPSATAAPGSAVEPKKSACDCNAVGASHGSAGAALAGAGAVVVVLRQRRRRAR